MKKFMNKNNIIQSFEEKTKIYNELLSSFNMTTKNTMSYTSEGDWPNYNVINFKLDKNNYDNGALSFVKNLFTEVESMRNRSTLTEMNSEKNRYSSIRAYYPNNDKIIITEDLDFLYIEFPEFLIVDKKLVDNEYNKFVKNNLLELNKFNKENSSNKKNKLFLVLGLSAISELLFKTIKKETKVKQCNMEIQIFLNDVFKLSLKHNLENYFITPLENKDTTSKSKKINF